MKLSTHQGGCHCRAVRFEVELTPHVEVEDCNCSICPASRFRLLQGESALTEYRFNTGAARHLFCKVCGIKSFYVPRSNPDGYAVTWRCIDNWQALDAAVEVFDGQNWEANAAALAHKSKD